MADADALIALLLEKDSHYKKAANIADSLKKQGTTIIFPVTVFPEAITTLKRAFNQPEKAHLISSQLEQGAYQVEYITEEILSRACQFFKKAVSKKNTFFDAIVAATAENLAADAVFSFDDWYPKLGLKLAETNQLSNSGFVHFKIR